MPSRRAGLKRHASRPSRAARSRLRYPVPEMISTAETRPVAVIVSQIAHGAPVEEILDGHPDLNRQDIAQALEYAADHTHFF